MYVFLAELQRLALLVGKVINEKWTGCTFVSGLPSHIRQHLQTSVRMDDMIQGLLKTRARVIMLDEKGGPITVATQLVRASIRPTSFGKSASHDIITCMTP